MGYYICPNLVFKIAELIILLRELLWAVYGCIQALENTGNSRYLKLAKAWQNWLDYAKSNVAKVRTLSPTLRDH